MHLELEFAKLSFSRRVLYKLAKLGYLAFMGYHSF